MTAEGAAIVQPCHIKAEWDQEAEVWVASSYDVPGLATGADTFGGLIAKLKVVIPELLEENGLLPPGTDEVPFAVFAERVEHARRRLMADYYTPQVKAVLADNGCTFVHHGKGDYEIRHGRRLPIPRSSGGD